MSDAWNERLLVCMQVIVFSLSLIFVFLSCYCNITFINSVFVVLFVKSVTLQLHPWNGSGLTDVFIIESTCATFHTMSGNVVNIIPLLLVLFVFLYFFPPIFFLFRQDDRNKKKKTSRVCTIIPTRMTRSVLASVRYWACLLYVTRALVTNPLQPARSSSENYLERKERRRALNRKTRAVHTKGDDNAHTSTLV